MRLRERDLRLVGAVRVYCDTCDREIRLDEARHWCRTCGRDACVACGACTLPDHVVAAYPGFARFEGPRQALLERVDTRLAETFGASPRVRHLRVARWLTRIHTLLSLKKHLQSPAPDTSRPLNRGARHAADLVWIYERGEEVLRQWLGLREMGRFVDYFDRRAFAGRLPATGTWLQSQGANAPLSWKGRPMLRTAWDFSLAVMMVQEIRPATIIELGTWSGGTAIWYADLQAAHGLSPNVITIDRRPPAESYAGVQFVRADVRALDTTLPSEILAGQPRPWLVVEDAHQDIAGVLRYFHARLERGDYLSIEDADAEAELVPFLQAHPGVYKVDTRYTDFFGHNATCAADQILCRMR